MPEDVSIDLGSAVPYLVEEIKGWFGKDALSEAARRVFENQFRISSEISSNVQCVGMSKPIPIDKIYQKTELSDSPYHDYSSADINELIVEGISSVIYAGPGDGKTTLTHWLFVSLLKSADHLPILITLRWPNSIETLKTIISNFESGRGSTKPKKKKIVLLVDGYDEISIENRRLVSDALRLFNSLDVGAFYLTCRNHYDIIDLPAPNYWINKFKPANAIDFCNKFFDAYNVEADAEKMLKDLHRKGFQSFTEHPLMLTLVCILQTTPILGLPRSALGLVRRAIDTLTLRWDESKGIARSTRIPLDGEERVRCLMRIAYKLDSLIGTERDVLQATKEHLLRQQIQRVNPKKLLEELAQWYGLLVPASAEEWGFVHRTIHDFLAARYWVESGEFSVKKVRNWNTRAAYAMSILPDSTLFLKQALNDKCEIHVLVHCLMNNAVFEPNEISKALISYINEAEFVFVRVTNLCMSATISANNDFFAYASVPFLESIILEHMKNPLRNNGIGVIAYCLYEFFDRDVPILESIYSQVIAFIGNQRIKLSVNKAGRIIEFGSTQIQRKKRS